MYCNKVTLTPTYRKEVDLTFFTLIILEESKLIVKKTNLLSSNQATRNTQTHNEAVDKGGKVYVNV